MEIVEVTWGRAVTVWWSIVWRSMVFGAIAGFVAGFILAIPLALFHFTAALFPLTMLGGFVAGCAAQIYAVKKVLYKRYGDFSVVLIANQ